MPSQSYGKATLAVTNQAPKRVPASPRPELPPGHRCTNSQVQRPWREHPPRAGENKRVAAWQPATCLDYGWRVPGKAQAQPAARPCARGPAPEAAAATDNPVMPMYACVFIIVQNYDHRMRLMPRLYKGGHDLPVSPTSSLSCQYKKSAQDARTRTHAYTSKVQKELIPERVPQPANSAVEKWCARATSASALPT